MNRFFLLFFGMVSLVAHAQVPDYVPTEGLVAWYPFNGNANDESGNGLHGEVNGAILTDDRFLTPNRAYSFSGNCQDRIDMLIPEMTENTSFSVSFWTRRNGTGCYNPRVWEFYGGSRTTQCSWFNSWDYITFSGFPVTDITLQDDNWYHFVLTNNGFEWKAYFNGELNNTEQDTTVINSPDLAIGRMNHPAWDSFNGDIDDFAIWNRELSPSEISALYSAELPIPGCTDSTACNFNEEANEDDNSCVYPPSESVDCQFGSNYCGEGTIWDSSLQICVGFDDCPADLNGNGLVEVSDLLLMLADFGSECPPEVAEFTCGDPVSYHGYDYATVQIGEQCWFAENLRNEHYANGDVIPANLSDGEWSSTTSGAVAVYGEDPGCASLSPDGNACDPDWSLNEYGRLYNWYAVDDERGLCPSEWHVPTDGQWMTLEILLGMSDSQANGTGWRGTDQGMHLKATAGFDNEGNGPNTYGFSALPGGDRFYDNGYFDHAGTHAIWWTSSTNSGPGPNSCNRRIAGSTDLMARYFNQPTAGMSVRCIKD